MPYIGVIFGNDNAHSPRVICLRKQKAPKEVMAKLNVAATMLAARPVYPR
jgi:hypothetical protein